MYDSNNVSYDPDKRKLLSAICHGAIFLSSLLLSVVLPLGVLLTSDDPIVKENAKESINFHFNVWFYGAIIAVLSFLTLGLVGFILAPIGFAIHWGLTVWAIIQVLGTPEQAVRYPFIFRLL